MSSKSIKSINKLYESKKSELLKIREKLAHCNLSRSLSNKCIFKDSSKKLFSIPIRNIINLPENSLDKRLHKNLFTKSKILALKNRITTVFI